MSGTGIKRISVIRETEQKNNNPKYKHRWIYSQSNYLQTIEGYTGSLLTENKITKEEIFEVLYFFIKQQSTRSEKDGTFPLMSAVLYEISINYTSIVSLLEELKIITIVKKNYHKGKCRMIRLNNFNENLICSYPIHNKSRFKHYDIQSKVKSKHHVGFKTLTNISIDKLSYEKVLSKVDLRNCDLIQMEKMIHTLESNGGLLTVEITDCEVHRIFYSTLSFLPKELRRCILINGQKWIEWDVSNSHPFFFYKLLSDKSFLLCDEVIKICGTKYIWLLNHTISKSELASFGKLASSGTMYQYFVSTLKMDKESVKLELRQTFYSAWHKGFFVDAFKKKFPGIYQLITDINGGSNLPLSHILMKTESLFLVDNVLHDIQQQDGNVVGLHDALLLTNGSQKELVKESLLKSFKKYNCETFDLPLFKDDCPSDIEIQQQKEILSNELVATTNNLQQEVNTEHIFDELDQYRKGIFKRNKITENTLMKRIPALKKMARLIKDEKFMELIDQVVAMDRGERVKEYIKIDQQFMIDYYSSKVNQTLSPYQYWKTTQKNKATI